MCPTGAVPRPTRSSIGCFRPTGITTGRSDREEPRIVQVYDDFFKGENANSSVTPPTRARTYYEAALARDSTFIPAAWRLSIVYRFLRVPLEELPEEALRNPGSRSFLNSIGELTAVLLDADLPRRFERYRATVAKFPTGWLCALRLRRRALSSRSTRGLSA